MRNIHIKKIMIVNINTVSFIIKNRLKINFNDQIYNILI